MLFRESLLIRRVLVNAYGINPQGKPSALFAKTDEEIVEIGMNFKNLPIAYEEFIEDYLLGAILLTK